MSKVSVLMPVYNGERYLREAIDSVLHQTLVDIQLICIDDASNDGTAAILREYAESDNRITLLTHSENTGQAVARNDGIWAADGEYITMVDADDWLSPEALELAATSLDADPAMGCVLFDLRYVSGADVTPYPARTAEREWSGAEAMELSLDWTIHGLYVARAELFKKYPYDTACRLYSDDNTTRIHYLHSDKVGCCNGIYYYRQHGGNMTQSESMHRYDLLEANTSMAVTLRAENVEDNVRAKFERARWINLTGISIYWMEHERVSASDDVNDGIRSRLRAVYDDIDRRLVPLWLRVKPGYRFCSSFGKYLNAVDRYRKARKLLKRGN